METAQRIILPGDVEYDQHTTSSDSKKKNYTTNNNKFFRQDLIDTPIYNEELMENVLVGIAQNIWVEMDKQRMTIRGLAELSCVNYSQLTKVFNNKAHIGLSSVITKGMDLASINYLLDVCAGYSKLNRNNRKL